MKKSKSKKSTSPFGRDAKIGDLTAADVALIEAPPRTELKLDLGAGQRPAAGFKGVDIMPGSDHVVDLFKFPWPFETSSVDEIHCSHFIEHIPAREVEERDIVKPLVRGPEKDETDLSGYDSLGKDFLFAFMDECYRILKPTGKMHVIVPCLRNSRAFQDPTHRRFIPEATFLYFNRQWREQNLLNHYKTVCDFGLTVLPTIPIEVGAYHPERQALMVNNYWNVVIDLDVQLVSNKK